MKKTFLTAIALLLVGTVALAGAPKLSQGLFDSAKQALVALASGDYEGLSDLLPFLFVGYQDFILYLDCP